MNLWRRRVRTNADQPELLELLDERCKASGSKLIEVREFWRGCFAVNVADAEDWDGSLTSVWYIVDIDGYQMTHMPYGTKCYPRLDPDWPARWEGWDKNGPNGGNICTEMPKSSRPSESYWLRRYLERTT